jgi:hypothetical protein
MVCILPLGTGIETVLSGVRLNGRKCLKINVISCFLKHHAWMLCMGSGYSLVKNECLCLDNGRKVWEEKHGRKVSKINVISCFLEHQ